MSLKLPNDKIVYNLPEQVGVNAENIKYLAEVYKDIDSIPAQFADMKTYFDDVMTPAFAGWTTTFQGWTNTLDTYLANMSSAALGAIANGTVAGNFSVNGNFTANSIIENMSGYYVTITTSVPGRLVTPIYSGVVKTGNKLTIVLFFKFQKSIAAPGGGGLISVDMPSSVGSKLHPYTLSGFNNLLDYRKLDGLTDANNYETIFARIQKSSDTRITIGLDVNELTQLNTDYLFRYECTFLLSDSLT